MDTTSDLIPVDLLEDPRAGSTRPEIGDPVLSVKNLTVDFPDCNSMHFTYQANAGLPASVPQGSGSRTWTRLTGINGLGCQ